MILSLSHDCQLGALIKDIVKRLEDARGERLDWSAWAHRDHPDHPHVPPGAHDQRWTASMKWPLDLLEI